MSFWFQVLWSHVMTAFRSCTLKYAMFMMHARYSVTCAACPISPRCKKKGNCPQCSLFLAFTVDTSDLKASKDLILLLLYFYKKASKAPLGILQNNSACVHIHLSDSKVNLDTNEFLCWFENCVVWLVYLRGNKRCTFSTSQLVWSLKRSTYTNEYKPGMWLLFLFLPQHLCHLKQVIPEQDLYLCVALKENDSAVQKLENIFSY